MVARAKAACEAIHHFDQAQTDGVRWKLVGNPVMIAPIRIQDLDRTQGIGERMMDIGDIHILSADPSKPKLVLQNVAEPDKVHEILRRAMLEARKKFRYSVQEEM